ISQLFKIFSDYRENTSKYHGLYFLKPMNRFFTGIIHEGNGISHLNLFSIFDTCNDITHIACSYFILWRKAHFKDTYFISFIYIVGMEKTNFIIFSDNPVEDSIISNNASE